MQFYNVWLRGIRGIFTWHSAEKVKIGARVKIYFRGKPRFGVVIAEILEKPDFQTQPILEVLDDNFINKKYLEIAHEVAYENLTSLEKVLNLIVPEKFSFVQNPAKKEVFYSFFQKPSPDLSQDKKLSKSGLKVFEISKIRGKKQLAIIEYLQKNGEAREEELLEIASMATIKTLLKKEIIEKRAGKLIPAKIPVEKIPRKIHELTAEQQTVFEKIEQKKCPSLLFGVTGSGKTEIYKNLAKNISLQKNKGQTLFLLPEIALTPQLLAEFRGIFGDQMAVWHSKLSAGEKIQEWTRCTSGEAKILIGARSAAFVPLRNPKLIILDEEHEWTFKSEFSPRIWTHDLAEKISRKFEAKLVLGSATPRVESFVKCENGEWDLVVLEKRVTEVQMPEISFIDLKNEAKKGNYGPISERLEEEINLMLAKKKQGILFLNRRGFFGSTTCKKCGTTSECPNCSFPMKLHRNRTREIMLCHVCGHLENFAGKCPECGEKDFEFRGWGTQQLEEILREKFPKLRVLRADADSTRRKNGFREIMEKFHQGEADILLGTQMIAKGLDFENVDLVGVILADIGLSLPDFRAEERVFQLLTQVAGRAGRRKNRGKILIQTFRPEENLFKFVKRHDTAGFIEWQKSHRQQMQMPPFINLAKITFSRRKKEEAFKLAKNFAGICQEKLGKEKVDWAPAFFPRSHNQYHFHVFIRLKSREKLIKFLHSVEIPQPAKIDIMPVSLL